MQYFLTIKTKQFKENLGYYCLSEFKIFIEDRIQLNTLLRILEESKYDIIKLEQISHQETIEYASDFIEQLKKEVKPRDLEFGNDNTDNGTNGTSIGDIKAI